jgi:hypothetical protein
MYKYMPCTGCGATGTNITTCPFNPSVVSPRPDKHNLQPLHVIQSTSRTKPAKPKSKPISRPKPAAKSKPASRPATKTKSTPVEYTLPSVDKYQAPKLPLGHVGIDTKQWEARKPISKKDRQALLDACGDQCYLIPEKQAYPVCAKDNSCKIDCSGVRAARNITHLIVNRHTVSEEAKRRALTARVKANELGEKHCGWKKL